MLAVEKGTPIHNLFMILTSDALAVMLKGEYEDQHRHCKEGLHMSDDRIKAMPRSYWRSNCRVSYGPPEKLLRALFNVYSFFVDMRDPLRAGHYVYVSNHHALMCKELNYVQEGLLSDPPTMNM